jgi:hypothetical protein
MTLAGVFNPAARAAIYLAGLDRCAGCGRPADSAQHRRARGMGGTSDVTIGHPANGVPVCGGQLAGVLGCHGWAERHPLDAELLGWRLAPGAPALGSPWYCLPWQGWRAWVEVEGCPAVAYVDELEDLDRLEERLAAVARLRLARPIPPPPAKPVR